MTLLEQSRDDLKTFFDTSKGWGVVAYFKRALDSSQTRFSIAFDAPYKTQNPGARVESKRRQVSFRTKLWDDAKDGDSIFIEGTEYVIQDPNSDGLGVTICTVEEAP